MMNGMLSLLQEACLSGESDKPEGDSGSTWDGRRVEVPVPREAFADPTKMNKY